MFLECELPYQAHYSCGLTTDFIEKLFPNFLSCGWQKTGTGMLRVRALENFPGIPRINCIVSFNLICMVGPETDDDGVVMILYFFWFIMVLVWVLFVFSFSLFAYIFILYWIVCFIKHPYLPYQTWPFWEDKCVCFLSTDIGSSFLSCNSTIIHY